MVSPGKSECVSIGCRFLGFKVFTIGLELGATISQQLVRAVLGRVTSIALYMAHSGGPSLQPA
jgi:hypothetical protein